MVFGTSNFMKGLKYFKEKEFRCPCCGKSEMDEEFVQTLDIARGFAGIPFKINSGWRCKEKNESLKNSSKNSAHLKGRAVDISCKDSRSRALILDALAWAGLNRFGISKTFIHTDNDPKKDKVVIWLYN